MKLMDYIDRFDKLYVYEVYCKIINNFKDYNKLSKNKMLNEIINFYQEPSNIIDICTEKELRYLERLIKKFEINKDKHFENTQLMDKFLLIRSDSLVIPEEFFDSISKALDVVDWNKIIKRDKLISFLCGICKVYGEISIDVLREYAICNKKFSINEIDECILRERLFSYYVLKSERNFLGVSGVVKVAIYREYEDYRSYLDVGRYGQEVSLLNDFCLEDFVNIFYYDFNINREIVRKFYDYYEKVTNGSFLFLKDILVSSLLNLDRCILREQLGKVLSLNFDEEKEFLRLMDLAMNEMPSGILNGMTPNEAIKNGIVENK